MKMASGGRGESRRKSLGRNTISKCFKVSKESKVGPLRGEEGEGGKVRTTKKKYFSF